MINEWRIEQLSRNLLRPYHRPSHSHSPSDPLDSSFVFRGKQNLPYRREKKHIFRDRVRGKCKPVEALERSLLSLNKKSRRESGNGFEAWDNTDILSSNKGIVEYTRKNVMCYT